MYILSLSHLQLALSQYNTCVPLTAIFNLGKRTVPNIVKFDSNSSFYSIKVSGRYIAHLNYDKLVTCLPECGLDSLTIAIASLAFQVW